MLSWIELSFYLHSAKSQDVSEHLKLMRIVWQKEVTPKAWAGIVLIPKEKDVKDISQSDPCSFSTLRGKSFSAESHWGCPLTWKGTITLIQLYRKQGFLGSLVAWSVQVCFGTRSKQLRRTNETFHVIFLDLANAFSSVPHKLLWKSFKFFHVLESITTLVKAYFQDLQLCFATPNFTTAWQCLDVGIMAGCTISPLAFMMAMEVIIRVSRWVVGGELRAGSVTHLSERTWTA